MTLRNAGKTGNDLNLIITVNQNVVNCGKYVFYRTLLYYLTATSVWRVGNMLLTH